MRFSRSFVRSVVRHVRLYVMTCVLVCAYTACAQSVPYKFDLGINLGMSGYLGDANRANLMSHPGFDGELSFRYIGDARWAVRGLFSVLGLSGNTKDMKDVLPGGAEYSFSSTVYDLGARGEFNFFPYGIGETYKRLRRWTPYLTVGVGVAMASVSGKSYIAPTIPMGLGVKFKISERWNLGAEFTMTKSFSDNFDGENLSDLNQIKTAFFYYTDWYSRFTIGISYEFGKRCETCHYVD